MAVAFDAKLVSAGSPYYATASGDPIILDTEMTVGTGSNRALLVGLVSQISGDNTALYTMYWDWGFSNQQLTKLGSDRVISLSGRAVSFWGLLNPASGTKTLLIDSGGAEASIFRVISAIALTGVKQTSLAEAFANFISADLSGAASARLTITSATGNMVATLFGVDAAAFTTIDPIEWWNFSGLAFGQYAAGAATKILGADFDSNPYTIAIGIDVVASTQVLVAIGKTVQPPTIGVPVMVALKTLTATSFAVLTPPTIGTAAFVQNYVFVGTPLTTVKPVFGTGALAQTHGLIANSFADSGITLPQPGLFIARVFSSPPQLAVGIPTLGAPVMGQGYALTAAWFPRQPTLGVGQLAQKQVLPVATSLTIGNLTIGVGSTSLGRQLLGLGIGTAPPVFGAVTPIQTHGLLAGGLNVARPGFDAASFTMRLALVGLPVAVSSPGFTLTGIDRTSFIPAPVGLDVSDPEFSIPSLGELLPPLVWFPVSRKRWSTDPRAEFYDDDGSQHGGLVKQAIFTNLNDEIELTVSTQTLVGRTSPGRGPAELILAAYPLYLFDRTLWIDWTDVELLREDLTIEIAARLAAEVTMNNAIAANALAITANANAIADVLNTSTVAISANTALLVTLRSDFERLLKQIKTFIPRDLIVSSPTLNAPLMGVF